MMNSGIGWLPLCTGSKSEIQRTPGSGEGKSVVFSIDTTAEAQLGSNLLDLRYARLRQYLKKSHAHSRTKPRLSHTNTLVKIFARKNQHT